ncbi:MAG: dTDP-4-dehydrorhamnose reductase [Solirubrobacteraceae bacterium]|jgi:dTDP-4-dehydrorhamnose reductase|nr:dTDP-4-dehydrorhamnose reductase [Solirubrobacteraceae bacterium]
MRLLVTGAAGMLGQDVVSVAQTAGHDVVALTRADLDITDTDAVRHAVLDASPSAVINCAAWTDVDGAESAEDAAAAINGLAAGTLAKAAMDAGAHIVQVSTDYVFAGDSSEPYLESDPVDPRTAYGRTKLHGEAAVREANPRHAIVRTAWVFGPGGKNFVDTMRRLAGERDEVTVVDDQVGCPTYTGHLAAALVEVAERQLTGTMHVAGSGQCSWHDLAAAAFEATGAEVTLHRGSSAELDRPAPRPAFSVLGTERDDTPRLPFWQDGLAAHLAASAARY